eukprot:8216215-Karenia_brevis.AAC.1
MHLDPGKGVMPLAEMLQVAGLANREEVPPPPPHAQQRANRPKRVLGMKLGPQDSLDRPTGLMSPKDMLE